MTDSPQPEGFSVDAEYVIQSLRALLSDANMEVATRQAIIMTLSEQNVALAEQNKKLTDELAAALNKEKTDGEEDDDHQEPPTASTGRRGARPAPAGG